MFRYNWFFMSAAFLSFTGCEPNARDPEHGKVTSEDVPRDVGKALETTGKSAEQSKEDFQRGFSARIEELEAEIAKLREKGGDLKEESKSNWERMVADLETKREVARVKLEEISNSSVAAWKDIQKGAQSAWVELDKAFHEAANKF